jgi:serine phosphatase RsbU (regulator of sigma subunit)/catechol 2,3-dioxygenase-like lactoylglutathione lyase family enzyme
MSSDFLRGETNQPDAGSDLQKPYLRLHTVNIYVRDQERSLEFYLEKLGFNLAFDTLLQSGERVIAVAPPDGTAVLRLIAPQPDSESYKLIGRPTQIAFLTEDVLAQFREWSRRGVRFPYRPRLRRIRYDEQGLRRPDSVLSPGAEQPVWGGVFARFEDIDGNSFTLAGLDELTRELEAQRRSITEKLEAERRAAQELEIAREVQARLFPQTLPRSGTLDYAGVCKQARQVGGDYYDFLNLGEERLGLVLADIAGKGIAAALLMANLQANLRSQCASAVVESRRFLESVNQLFYENTTESAYATLFFGDYEDKTRTLRYANCGHLPALVLRNKGTWEYLDSTGTVLGLFSDWHCLFRQCRLFPGDTLVLYSDGVTESFDDNDEQFGEQRLIQTLERHRNLPAEGLVNSILDDVRRFSPREQHDDITLIVARCKETA